MKRTNGLLIHQLESARNDSDRFRTGIFGECAWKLHARNQINVDGGTGRSKCLRKEKMIGTIKQWAGRVGGAAKQLATNGTAKFAALLALGLSLMAFNAQAQSSIVTESGGTVTFTPSAVVGPVITATVAAIAAAATLVILFMGIRWVYRAIKVK